MGAATSTRWWYAMPFRDEVDMLRCQLVEHAERIHKFVIMEANVDHSGQPKPFVLERHWEDFKPWHDLIEYVQADWLPTFEQNSSYWFREQKQRDVGMPYLTSSAAGDDMVIISDVDEFVPASAFATFLDLGSDVAGLVQKLRFAAVDWDGSPGVTAVMARAQVIKTGGLTLDTLRQRRQEFPPIEPGGYHFSWFGGPERIVRKAICSPHQETLDTNLRLAREGLAWQRGLGGIPDNEVVTGNYVPVTWDYPKMVRERTCPWYWWRPDVDNLPVDPLARWRELNRRNDSAYVTGTCADGRQVRVLEPGSYHLDDLTPCPTAAALAVSRPYWLDGN